MDSRKSQIQQFITEHSKEMLATLEEIVRLEDFFDEKDHVETCMAYVRHEFEAEGFVCHYRETSEKRAGVLVGTLGADRPSAPIVFSGHLDTVHPSGSFSKEVFRVEDGKIFGPGALDMKGGVIIALYVVKALNHLGYCERPIKIVFAGDEESDHIGGNADEVITEESRGALCVFNMEIGNPGNELCVARKSLYNVYATVKGIGGHSGNFFEQGRNAVHEAALKTCEMIPLTDLEKGTTVTTSVFRGGDVVAKIPDHCELAFDLRYATAEEGERLLKSVKTIMETTHIDGTSTEYEIVKPKFAPYEAREDVLQCLNFVNKVMRDNELPEFGTIKKAACSDAGNIQAAGVPILDSCGIVGDFAHSLQEYADVQSMYDRTLIWTLVVLNAEQFL